MNFYDSKAKLSFALEKLKLRWGETQTDWRDAVSRDFQEQFLDPLEEQVATTMGAIDRLVDVLRGAEQDCKGFQE